MAETPVATPASPPPDAAPPAAAGWRRAWKAAAPYVVPMAVILVFALTAWSVYRLSTEVHYDDVRAAVTATRWSAMGWAVLFTGLSFAALICYDFNALAYIHRRLPPVPVAVTAFSAYAVGNTLGFGALSGGAIRFRAYSRLGLSPDEIARVIAFVTLAFGLGLLGVSSLAAIVTARQVAPLAGLSPELLRGLAVLCLMALGIMVWLSRHGREVRRAGIRLRLPDTATSARQFLVTAFDLAAAATVLYVLLPQNQVSWITFVAIYATAIGLGVLSHVPAGLGVFETVIIAALGNRVPLDVVLSSLVLYRVIYHVLPLIVAAVLMIAIELRAASRHPMAASLLTLEPRLTPPILAALALIGGTLLIFSAVTPTPDSDLDFLASYVPLWVVEGAHFLSSILGLVLFISARGLGQRLDGAWWVAMAATLSAILLSFLHAFPVYTAALLVILTAGLFFARHQFTRPASLIRQALAPAWIVAMFVVVIGAATILFFVYRDVEYSDALWWQFEFGGEAPRGLRAVLGLALAAMAVAIASLLRPARHEPEPASAEDLARAAAITAAQDSAGGNLVRMGDKAVIFSESGRSFLMYGVQGGSWIALFDPVGPEEERAEMVWRFVEAARDMGRRAVLYQITPALLQHCADAGLRAYKLGELAVVDLSRFDLKASRYAPLRHALNRGGRDGLSFEVLEPGDAVAAVMPDLAAVSDAWLAQHEAREKSFSLGSFDPAYVVQTPVAVLRGAEGRILAFATLLVTDTRAEGTVDLMRFTPEAPRSAMDFLFTSIMQYLKDQGFARFNLGMAPLSGMSKREAAPVWDRLGAIMFEHGEKFYNFQGLKAFKSKFQPDWKPRYLAVSGGATPMVAMMDATLLIGGGFRGVVGK